MKSSRAFSYGLLLAIFSLIPVYSHAEYFTITDFNSEIVIHANGHFTVTETIKTDFHRERHGIYREIPYRYEDELGKTVLIPIDVISVTDENGKEINSKVSKQGNVVNIRIGDANKYVFGEQIYVIKYEVTGGLLYFDDHDELYWNVTGNSWETSIEKTTAIVTFDPDLHTDLKDIACYTGRYTSSDSYCTSEKTADGVKFYLNQGLSAYHGFTIAFGFDKGLVAQPSALERFLLRINLSENWVFILPLLSLLFMIHQYRTKGRDPKVRDAVAVQYHPPKINGKELTAAEVGTLIDENLNQRDISASMIGLAVKGYMKIEEIKDEGFLLSSTDYRLTALKTNLEELTEFERWLMAGLFESGESEIVVSELKNKFYRNLPDLYKAIFKQLVNHKFFAVSPNSVRAKYAGYGVLVVILVGALQLFLNGFEITGRGIFVTIFSALPFFLFSKAMPAKTRAGAFALSEIFGFQEFLQRAEKDKLERMADKDLFSKYLPYAIALNVVDQWAKAFVGIEQNLPTWYIGARGFTHFHPVAFSNAINATTSHLATATFSAPRGSGTSGGGGGFSGGGGGGGGGGSW